MIFTPVISTPLGSARSAVRTAPIAWGGSTAKRMRTRKNKKNKKRAWQIAQPVIQYRQSRGVTKSPTWLGGSQGLILKALPQWRFTWVASALCPQGKQKLTPCAGGRTIQPLVKLPESTKKVKKGLDRMKILWYNKDTMKEMKTMKARPPPARVWDWITNN